MDKRFNRRQFLKSLASLAGAWALPRWALARAKGSASQTARTITPAKGYRYFTAAEVDFVDAVAARLIPADDLGPGAKEAGAAVFIDRQLVGPYGQALTWYMRGPFRKGDPKQGYQSHYTPAQMYRAGIRALERRIGARFQGKFFSQLQPKQQDSILHELESGKLDLGNVPAKEFFTFLHKNTVQSFFADPIHGGNRNMIGWKLIGFPGVRGNYRDYIENYGKRYPLPPVSIQDKS
jgi:gluconate 2-dehydrogenase gamma chain